MDIKNKAALLHSPFYYFSLSFYFFLDFYTHDWMGVGLRYITFISISILVLYASCEARLQQQHQQPFFFLVSTDILHENYFSLRAYIRTPTIYCYYLFWCVSLSFTPSFYTTAGQKTKTAQQAISSIQGVRIRSTVASPFRITTCVCVCILCGVSSLLLPFGPYPETTKVLE